MHKFKLKIFLVSTLCVIGSSAFAQSIHYASHSMIDASVTVYDANANPQPLLSLIQQKDKSLNVVFIFGGGAMGYARANATGGLWCPDSFEDLHILRSLKAAYGDDIGIFPIAVPPAHHTQQMGLTEGIFLHPDPESNDYQKAVVAFIDSTLGAEKAGTIPVETFFDLRYNILLSSKDLEHRQDKEAWHGAFRSPEEQQTYGVPSLWLIDGDGRVLREPYRGNVYHPHGGEVSISYTLTDITRALAELKETAESK